MMETKLSSETSVLTRAKLRHILQDGILQLFVMFRLVTQVRHYKEQDLNYCFFAHIVIMKSRIWERSEM
jgi:hypothetical protein